MDTFRRTPCPGSRTDKTEKQLSYDSNSNTECNPRPLVSNTENNPSLAVPDSIHSIFKQRDDDSPSANFSQKDPQSGNQSATNKAKLCSSQTTLQNGNSKPATQTGFRPFHGLKNDAIGCSECGSVYSRKSFPQIHICKHWKAQIADLYLKETRLEAIPKPPGLHTCQLC